MAFATPEPRHLHESGEQTLCGLRIRRSLPRARHMVAGSLDSRVVHVTKARRSDCARCRTSYRRALNWRALDERHAAALRRGSL